MSGIEVEPVQEKPEKFFIETRIAVDGKPYSVIVSSNGQDVWVSQTYEEKANMNKTINSFNTFLRSNGAMNLGAVANSRWRSLLPT